jgi:hypothetical protein
LSEYAGSYYSEELGATYTVEPVPGGLRLRTRWGSDRLVRPAYGDTFAGDFLLSFTRGADGRVVGMSMSSGRVRGVGFEKLN